MKDFLKKSLKITFFLLFMASFNPLLYASTPIRGPGFDGAAAGNARQRLMAAADALLGTPYRYAGLDRRGLDCSGFVHLSFREGLNQTVPRTTVDFYNWVQKIPTGELQPGDLVFFVTVGSRVSHMGIYTGNGWFIHAASDGPNTGVIYSHLDENYWRRTYLGAGRALPWSIEAAAIIASSPPDARNSRPGANPPTANPSINSPPVNSPPGNTPPVNSPPARIFANSGSGNTGFYRSLGAAWIWGDVFNSNMFRGLSLQASVGYRWDNFMAGLQFRPGWDNNQSILYLPLAITFGINNINIFGGPALMFTSSGQSRFNWEFGLSAHTQPVAAAGGAVSMYGELSFHPNFSSNPSGIRFTTGFRYFFDR